MCFPYFLRVFIELSPILKCEQVRNFIVHTHTVQLQMRITCDSQDVVMISLEYMSGVYIHYQGRRQPLKSGGARGAHNVEKPSKL